MTGMTTNERRPAGAASEVIAATETSVPQSSTPTPRSDLASRVREVYAILVIGKATRGHGLIVVPLTERVVHPEHVREECADVMPVCLIFVGPVRR
jgi:hypothetical protein